ncbi:MAG: hypothetical protein WA702_06335 [Bradyrhizobium sp.]|jgi:hypothetical protein|uniref:hypothetical protein n=1 Tax=Bradyrhizobium sp. TaxID=376 RepID=UPI003C7D208E
MAILVDLAKLGALGASLAFLYLSFQLLKGEQELKDRDGNPAQPRSDILAAVVNFRRAALTFLVVGVLLEFFLTQGPVVIAAINQSVFNKSMLRVRFNAWEFSPETKYLSFGFEENRSDTAGFIPSALKNQYAVYVGVRKKDASAPEQGEYKVMFGPYSISNQHDLDRTLTDEELAQLGNGCILFTAFGVLRSGNNTPSLAKPFKPAEAQTPLAVFNWAATCSE